MIISCKEPHEKRKDIVSKRIELINEQLEDWNELKNMILKDGYVNNHLGKMITPSDLNEQIATELDKKGIRFLSVTKNSDCHEVEFATDWTEYPIGSLYLSWTTCDIVKTQHNYYQNNGFIEVWGAGNNWVIWVDSDFI